MQQQWNPAQQSFFRKTELLLEERLDAWKRLKHHPDFTHIVFAVLAKRKPQSRLTGKNHLKLLDLM